MQTSGSADPIVADSTERTGCSGVLGGQEDSNRRSTLWGSPAGIAPVLVLGLGNPLMADDGAGQALLATLESAATDWGNSVEFVDGGTQGLALLGQFEDRKAVIFLDAIRLGDPAGAVHVLEGDELCRLGGARAKTAHEGSAPQILSALQLLEQLPKHVAIVGLEPERIETGIGLSSSVQSSLGVAASFARMTITKILTAI